MTLKPLLKVYALGFLGINRAQYAHDPAERTKLSWKLIGAALLGLTMLGMFFLYSFTLGSALRQAGLLDLLPPLFMAVACLFVLFTTIYKGSGVLFSFRDYDLVMSLPIRTDLVVASRVLILYAMNIAFVLMVMVPCGVAYAILGSPPPLFYLYFILSLPFLPLIPLVVAAALGVLITAAASRLRWKNAVTIVLSIAFCLLAVVFPMFFAGGDVDVAALSASLSGQITRLYPPAGLFADAVCGRSAVSFALFLVISSGVFALFCVLTGRVFKSLHSALTAARTRSDFRLGGLRTSGALSALWKKELRRYFSSSIYVLNTGIGLVLMTALSVSLLFFSSDQLAQALEIPGFDRVLETVAPLVLAAFLSMTCTTGVSVSLEGRSLWIAKSLPVGPEAIFKSKIALNLTLQLAALAVNAPLFAAALRPSPLGVLWLFLVPAAYALLTSVGGLCVNLAFPKLDWTNEVTVIKQSASAMVATFGGMLCAAVPFFPALLSPGVDSNLLMGLTALGALGASFALWKLLRSWGARAFRAL